MPKGYTTRQRVENFLLINVDPSFHDQVDDWIDEVESRIDRMTDRSFVADAEATPRFFSGDASNVLAIDDCVEVTSVRKGSPLEVLDVGQYHGAQSNAGTVKALVADGWRWPRGEQNVEVTARWGYSAEVPKDLRTAATVMVSDLVNAAWADGVQSADRVVASESIGRYSVSYESAQAAVAAERPKVDEIIESYRKRHF